MRSPGRHRSCRSHGRPTVMVVSHEASRTGAPRVAIDVVKGFADAGWRTVVVLRWGGPLEDEFCATADRVVREPLRRVRAALRRRRSTRVLALRTARWAARRVVAAERPDLVWCNTVISSGYAVAAAAENLPSVVHSHEHADVVRRSLDQSGLADLLSTSPPDTRRPALVACAPATAVILAREVGCDVDDVEVLYSPVDVAEVREHARPDEDQHPVPRIVGVGLGNRTKGVDVFGAAAELDVQSGVRAKWQWVGDVSGSARVDAVEYLGSMATAAPVIAAAAVFVLPSRADAFPLVVLEAMALGRCVVASDLPGPREQLGPSGVFVPPGDARALHLAVHQLLADPERAAALGRAAARRCEELWDLPRFTQRVSEIANAVADR